MVFFQRRQLTREEAEELAGRFLNSYGNSMLRFAYAFVHNYEDAEEIVQDAVIRVLHAAPEFENERHEKAYLLSTVANLSKNRIDYNKIRMTDELDENLQEAEREDLAFVWDAVRLLPEKYRVVIHLHYYEGYSTEEISKCLKRNHSTVRSDLNRGRQKLKEILKEDFDFE